MAKKSERKGQQDQRLAVRDERVRKIGGILCILLALYLFIAFTSYLFTWQEDQDKVLRFSWSLLFQSELSMANWLGRLGAIVSNLFFYWGFGLPSYIFVWLLTRLGISLIRAEKLYFLWPIVRASVIGLVFFSILFEFLFPGAAFPFGGAFGESLMMWLRNFLGAVGLALLLIFCILAWLTWILNPDFNETSFREIVEEIKFNVLGVFDKRYRKRQTPPQPPQPDTSHPQVATLRPSSHLPKTDLKEDSPTTKDQLQLDFNTPKMPQLTQQANGTKPQPTQLEVEVPPNTSATNDPASDQGEAPTALTQAQSVQAENETHTEPYDPTLELSHYEYPILGLLNDYSDERVEVDRTELEANKDQIIETLLNYKIEITKIRATIGPTVTLYEIVPAPGVRISKIKNLEDDIALSLAALGIRIIAPIPGRGTIGIEVPNKRKQIVSMKEVLMSDKFQKAKMDLPIALGKTISNEVFVADLAKMPHLLIAGATGQGKSVGINAILMSLLYKKHPSQIKLVLIDPKKVELFPYAQLNKHFLAFLPGEEEPITTETNKVIHTLNSLTIEMDQRYDLLKKAHVRHINEYNQKFIARKLSPLKGHRFLPYIVLIIDEFADLIMTAGKEIELPIGRLAQLARAVGIHLIIATQRPSVNIITGVIKANFPARIAYKVASKVDSRTILDAGGAEQLIGRGDMLFSVGGDMIRLQCAFVDTSEVERVIRFVAEQPGYPEPFFLPEYVSDEEHPNGASAFSMDDLDPLWEDAARLVVQNQHGSTSMIQRRLKLGYNRAGRIMDQLEALGIVGPAEGSKPREVLIFDELELERYLSELKNRK